jgi:hypothetical protein
MIVSIPKFNYCDVAHQIRTLPIISDGLAQIAKFRDGRMGCPIRMQRYLLTNFSIDEQYYSILGMLMVKDRQKYMVDIKITDENRKPIVAILKYEFNLMVIN